MEEVYPAAEDSWLLEEIILKEKLAGKKCLDLGCGSGIQALAMLKAGAMEVLCADVNESALEETTKKVKNFLSGTKKTGTSFLGHFLGARKSDLFSNIKEKFDFIAFNPPYVPSDEIKWRDLDGGEAGRVVIDEFLNQVKSHLNSKGVLLLLVTSLNGVDEIQNKLKKEGFEVSISGKKKLFFEELVVLRVRFPQLNQFQKSGFY